MKYFLFYGLIFALAVAQDCSDRPSSTGSSSTSVNLQSQINAVLAGANALSVNDVQTIIAQAVSKAQGMGLSVTVAVTDKEGNVLGVFQQTGANPNTTIGAFDLLKGVAIKGGDADGLQGQVVPAFVAAISKAGTAAFFSTQGSAFTTRTASFIIQEHFPAQSSNTPGGPLFGVQFSQLPCSDVRPASVLPLGLSGDPGGVAIYKNGLAAGGVGIELDGFYSVDFVPQDTDLSVEEVIATAATIGYQPDTSLRSSNITIDGRRLPYTNNDSAPVNTTAFASLPGSVIASFPVVATPASRYTKLTLGGVPGKTDARFFPFKSSADGVSGSLTVTDVNTIITQAAQQAYRTRGGIRLGGAVPAEVNITVVDTNGIVLGLFSTQDAPEFGFDVSAQKARTANFMSRADAGTRLSTADAGIYAKYVTAAQTDGIALNGSVAFSVRGFGFLNRPYFPDGIDDSLNGPFSKSIDVFSPFNTGLQLAAAKQRLLAAATALIAGGAISKSCTAFPELANGLQIFAGGVPLYRNGILIGAIGISGDGIEQDDLVAAAGSAGFEAPVNIRCDNLQPRGVRLPYVKFPRFPNL